MSLPFSTGSFSKVGFIFLHFPLSLSFSFSAEEPASGGNDACFSSEDFSARSPNECSIVSSYIPTACLRVSFLCYAGRLIAPTVSAQWGSFYQVLNPRFPLLLLPLLPFLHHTKAWQCQTSDPGLELGRGRGGGIGNAGSIKVVASFVWSEYPCSMGICVAFVHSVFHLKWVI